MEGERPRSEAKGKGKGAGPGPEGTQSHSGTEKSDSGPSLSRMTQSTASFLLSGPPTTGLGVGNEKADSSRAGEALARAGESSVQLRSKIPSGETMRIGQTQEHIAQEEASFAAFLDSDEVPMLSGPSEPLEGAWQSAVPAGVPVEARAAELPSQSILEQEAKDGADVVALLLSDGDLDQVFEQVHAPASEEDLAGLRKALFDEEAGHGSSPIPWDNVLNFIPEYLQAHTAPATSQGANLSLHLGSADPEEGWQTWIGQWSRVLTSYQDEVWGDLGALVEEARAEVQRIEETKAGEIPPKPKALLRLRAILGHLRGAP
ncbi:hypothetical protein N0V88_004473 [Collariella sp. IMI 366227]|nr:hypothetical protein N0V88_004473 [Collariella sp. IMI 366227]